jgi:3-methyladenine DNA glycosylase AlkD
MWKSIFRTGNPDPPPQPDARDRSFPGSAEAGERERGELLQTKLGLRVPRSKRRLGSSPGMTKVDADVYLSELTAMLIARGNARREAALKLDRGSNLEFLGVEVLTRRQVALKEFRLRDLTPAQELEVYDHIWRTSPYSEVMSIPLLYYYAQGLKIDAEAFETIHHWVDRLDNWAHCDELSGVISYLNHKDPGRVMPDLAVWNRSGELWKVRTSIVSLIHYSGKNSVYLTPGEVLPFLGPHLENTNGYVAKAVRWVLREMSYRYPDEVAAYIAEHRAHIPSTAQRRAGMARPAP